MCIRDRVADKLSVIENLLNKADVLIIGGGMAYTFLAAKGYSVGHSLLDNEKIDYCREMIKKADEKGVTLLLPVDCVAVSYTHLPSGRNGRRNKKMNW